MGRSSSTFRHQLAAPARRQRGTDIGGGQLDQLRIIQQRHLGPVLLLQRLLLPLHGSADILLHAAESGDMCQRADNLRLVPCMERETLIRTPLQPQLRIGILLMQRLQGVAGIALAGAMQLDIAGLRTAAHRGSHQRCHSIALLRRNTVRQRLMGRHTGRHDQQPVQRQLLCGGAGQCHMAVMGRIKRPAENADPHFTFTNWIFRFSLLC